MTVTEMARACGLSRTALLYYESMGLLRPPRRTAGNYRAYGTRDLERLKRICAYRGAGLKIEDIRSLLDDAKGDAAGVLERRLSEIGEEIERLRTHQRDIARLLHKTDQLRTNDMVTKDKWVSVMRAAGFNDEQMKQWHKQFEKTAPAEHQEFLEFLHIPAEEIKNIRAWSAK